MRVPLRLRALIVNSGIASASALLLAAMVVGCDPGTGPTMSTEENKAAVEARSKSVADEEKKAADALGKKGKNIGGGLKSIKGGLKPAE